MKCAICDINEGIYKCPRCNMFTCSVVCSKQHKIKFNCSGEKEASKFVPLKEMNANVLYKDVLLFDETRLKLINSDKLKLKFKKTTSDMKKLKKLLIEKLIMLQYMPSVSSRHKENESYFNKETKTVMWSLRIKFFKEDPKKVLFNTLLHNVPENYPIGGIIKACIDTVQNDYVASLNMNDVIILLVVEGAPRDARIELLKDDTLESSLINRVVIEYPIINIAPSIYRDKWNLVDPFVTSQQINVDSVEDKRDITLPSYKDIEEALKKDMIRSSINRNDNESISISSERKDEQK